MDSDLKDKLVQQEEKAGSQTEAPSDRPLAREEEIPALIEHDKKRLKYQVAMFFLCYFTYSTNHIYREMWAVSKTQIVNEGLITKAQLGQIDTLNFWVYGLSQYIAGSLGDIFDLRKMLPISYACSALCMVGVGLGGLYQTEQVWWYYLMFGLLGVVQSCNFPAIIAVVSNWMPAGKRGLFMGLFITCTNVGNIIGVQVGSAEITAVNDQWGWVMLTAAVFFAFFAIINLFFLVPEPDRVGLFIEEGQFLEAMTKKEQIAQEYKSSVLVQEVVEVEEEEGGSAKQESLAGSQRDRRDAQSKHALYNGSVLELENENKPVDTQSILEKQRSMIENYVEETKLQESIPFLKAWLLPNMLPYTAAFFFCKYARDAIAYNLPEFLNEVYPFNQTQNANISSMNDMGAIFSGFVMGYISDLTWGKRSPISLLAVICSGITCYTLAFTYLDASYVELMVFFFFFGFFLSGVTNTIASTCSADIGRGSGKSKKAVSTITGIIDGTGSMGSGLAQLITGRLDSWFFYLLQVALATTLVSIPLSFIFYQEVGQIAQIRKEKKQQTHIDDDAETNLVE